MAYIVGGSVRDFLLKRPVKDHDIATSAKPDELCELFPRAITVGKAFGVIKVPIDGVLHPLEIATFREDEEYKNHRHPTKVRFTGPIEDAHRRDFTINGLFYDPKTSRVLDSVGGFDDLKAGILRAIGNPSERFKEDALRLLRAVRFATALDFEIEALTKKAIQERSRLIVHVSSERVRDELTLMLKGPKPAESLSMLSDLGLLAQVLHEVNVLKGIDQAPTYYRLDGVSESRSSATSNSQGMSIWKTTLKTLRELAKNNPTRGDALCWAAALYDVGKPAALKKNKGKNFNGHEIEGARIARLILERLKLTRADIDQVTFMVEDLHKFREVFKMREATVERFVRQPFFEELLALHRAQAIASDGNLAYYEFCLFRFNQATSAGTSNDAKLIDGKDLINMGFTPGPEFSEILRVVEDMAFEKKLTSKEQALDYVVTRFVK